MAIVQRNYPDSIAGPRPQEPMSIWLRIEDGIGNDRKELGELKERLLAKVREIAPPECRVTGGTARTDKLANAFRFL